jgi:hypothetical protein
MCTVTKIKTYSRMAHAIRWLVEVWDRGTLDDAQEFETEAQADQFIKGVLS